LGSGLVKKPEFWIFLCCLEEEGGHADSMWVCKVVLLENGHRAQIPGSLFLTHATLATSLTQEGIVTKLLEEQEDNAHRAERAKAKGKGARPSEVFNDAPKLIGSSSQFFIAARGLSQKTVFDNGKGSGMSCGPWHELGLAMANTLADEIPTVQQVANCLLFFRRVERQAVIQYTKQMSPLRNEQERLWIKSNQFIACWVAVKAAFNEIPTMATDESDDDD